jgi:transposase-like protein
MTQDEIKKKYAASQQLISACHDDIADAQALIAAERALLVAVQRRCKHPDGYETSTMGDSGFRCPDCGYSR